MGVRNSAFIVTTVFCAAQAIASDAKFIPLGFLPDYDSSSAAAIARDSSTIVGSCGVRSDAEAFGWTLEGGMFSLGSRPPLSESRDVSDAGKVICGYFTDRSKYEAFRWTKSGGFEGLGDLPGGKFYSTANGITRDGTVIVGASDSKNGTEAFRYTAADGMVPLGDLKGGNFDSIARKVSNDGRIIVGYGTGKVFGQPVRWVDGEIEQLDDHNGDARGGQALNVSGDGQFIVGNVSISDDDHPAALWKENKLNILGDIPGGLNHATATGVSDDGRVVVGWGSTEENLATAFIWTQSDGMRELKTVLESDFQLDLKGWTLSGAQGISADGKILTGVGTNPDGEFESWAAVIPEPNTALLLLGILAFLSIAHARST